MQYVYLITLMCYYQNVFGGVEVYMKILHFIKTAIVGHSYLTALTSLVIVGASGYVYYINHTANLTVSTKHITQSQVVSVKKSSKVSTPITTPSKPTIKSSAPAVVVHQVTPSVTVPSTPSSASSSNKTTTTSTPPVNTPFPNTTSNSTSTNTTSSTPTPTYNSAQCLSLGSQFKKEVAAYNNANTEINNIEQSFSSSNPSGLTEGQTVQDYANASPALSNLENLASNAAQDGTSIIHQAEAANCPPSYLGL